MEVGIGSSVEVMEELKENLPGCQLIATDVRKVPVPEGVEFFRDDIFEPDLSIYRGSDLIYSLRAPPELYSPLCILSRKIKADLLLKPLSSEESPENGKLVNFSGASFYLVELSEK